MAVKLFGHSGKLRRPFRYMKHVCVLICLVQGSYFIHDSLFVNIFIQPAHSLHGSVNNTVLSSLHMIIRGVQDDKSHMLYIY